MHRLERSQLLPLPIDEAFDFFADAHNLESITPPWLHFSIVTPAPVPMGKGTLIDYELRLRGRGCTGNPRSCSGRRATGSSTGKRAGRTATGSTSTPSSSTQMER